MPKAPEAQVVPVAPLVQPAFDASGQGIPLTQVADEGEELDRRLETISKRLAETKDEIAPDKLSDTEAAAIRDRALRTDKFIEDLPDVLQLRDEVVYWRALNHESAERRRLLAARAADLLSDLRFLDEQEFKWQATHDHIHDTSGIEVVAARVQGELDAIRQLRQQTQEQLNQILILQDELSQTGRRIADSLAKLADAEERFRGHILDRDGLPLWSPRWFREGGQPALTRLHSTAQQDVATADEFLRTGAAGLLLIPVVFVVAVLGVRRLRDWHANDTQRALSESDKGLIEELLAHPYSIALLAGLLISIPLTVAAPISVSLMFYVFWLVSVFRLAPILIAVKLRPFVSLLLALTLLEVFRVAVPLSSGVQRLAMLILYLGALIGFGWLARPTRLNELHLSKWPKTIAQAGLRIGLLLMALAFIANVCGFLSLSHVLGVGTLLSAFFAAATYCILRIALLSLSAGLNSRWAGMLSDDARRNIKVWGTRSLVVLAVFLWWTRSELYVFMLHDSVTATISQVLDYSIELGRVHFSLRSILNVVLIVGVGYGLAKATTSLLRSILLAKFPLQRGLPYAVSKVVYYCLLLMVFAAAITAAGVELNKFTVITGALGVGVGFGLQNIVSNFASGLILLFERPIRIGDTVEVNNLIGTVKRIGARSSTITTGQGAEVIVPNSNLLSNQVINWTLSSPLRRVEIPIGTAYGSDPEAVLELLVGTATAHPDVMQTPGPEAFFLGFGESALNFELRFWSAQQESWFRLKSDVSINVSNAFRDAGIEIPFPQRDLHLRSMDGSLSELGRPLADTGPAQGGAIGSHSRDTTS